MKGFNTIVLVGLLIILIWVATGFTLPAFQQYRAAYEQWSVANTENRELQNLKAEIKKINLGEIQTYAANFDYFLPKDYRPQELVLLLKSFVKASGVTVKEISLGKVETLGTLTQDKLMAPLGVVKIELTTVGSYVETKKFLGYLETSARVFETQAVEVKKEKDELISKISVFSYYVQ